MKLRRESSDDLRVRDSQKLQVLTLEERSQQLIERERILDDEVSQAVH